MKTNSLPKYASIISPLRALEQFKIETIEDGIIIATPLEDSKVEMYFSHICDR